MIAIDQVVDCLRLVLLIYDSQMIRLNVHREFSIANEVHVAFFLVILDILILFIVLRVVSLRVDVGQILLLQVNEIGASEDAVELGNKLGDTFVILFQRVDFAASLGHTSAECLQLGVDEGFLDKK